MLFIQSSCALISIVALQTRRFFLFNCESLDGLIQDASLAKVNVLPLVSGIK